MEDGGPAFPMQVSFLERQHSNEAHRFTHDIKTVGGMSLRDWFAGLAMQAQITADDTITFQAAAAYAYRHADAMLKSREQTP